MARPNKSTGLSLNSVKLEETILLFLGTAETAVSPPDIRKHVNHLSILLSGTPLSEKEINYGISLLYQKNYLSTENGHYVVLNPNGKRKFQKLLREIPRSMLEKLIEYSLWLKTNLVLA